MKNVVNILILTVLFTLLSCEGDYSITYEFTGLSIEHAENTGEAPAVTNVDSIPANAYVLRLNLYPKELSRSGRYLDRETPPTNVNAPDSILVISNMDFDSDHPAGTSLNDFFLIFNHSYFYTSDLEDLLITNQHYDGYYDTPWPEFADLLLTTPPEISGNHKFFVYLRLKDGTEFIDSTNAIKLY